MTKVFKSIIILLSLAILYSCDLSPVAMGPSWKNLQFASINDAFNWVTKNITYKTDVENYNYNDYWASPDQCFEKKSGDCEDQCILFMAIVYNNFNIKMILVNNNLGHAEVRYSNDYYDVVAGTISKTIKTADKYAEYDYDVVMTIVNTTHNAK